jgi:hypothetical protein
MERRLRDLERQASTGDAEARSELIRKRAQSGLCPWCGKPGAIHSFVAENSSVSFDACCCCNDCFKEHGVPNGGVCPECPGANSRAGMDMPTKELEAGLLKAPYMRLDGKDTSYMALGDLYGGRAYWPADRPPPDSQTPYVVIQEPRPVQEQDSE